MPSQTPEVSSHPTFVYLWKNACVLVLGLGNPSSLSQNKRERREVERARNSSALCSSSAKPSSTRAAPGLMSYTWLRIIMSSVWPAEHCKRHENVVKDMINWQASAKWRIEERVFRGISSPGQSSLMRARVVDPQISMKGSTIEREVCI